MHAHGMTLTEQNPKIVPSPSNNTYPPPPTPNKNHFVVQVMNIQCASKVVLNKSKSIAQLMLDNAESTEYIITITDMLNNI